jgi:class 3 adenylate cyclase/tetratricopeptide (TPR) repeat protein
MVFNDPPTTLPDDASEDATAGSSGPDKASPGPATPAHRRYEVVDRRSYLAKLCRSAPYNYVEAVLARPEASSLPPFWEAEGTMLVGNLVGFSRLVEQLSSQTAGGLSGGLNALFAGLLEEGVFPWDGYVLSFGGDTLSAYFTGEGHALRAAAAAHACLLALQRIARRDLKSTDLFFRAGLASGRLRLALLGDLVQRHVMPVGAVPHLAADLAVQAEPSEIRLDMFCEQEAGEALRTEPVGGGVVRLLEVLETPPVARVVELDDRLKDHVEKKIALIEPFVPKPLARRMRTSPPGWRVEGERREMVVLAVRISAINETLMRGDLERTNDISRSFVRSIRKYGGIMLKGELMPDHHRLLVLFGLHRPTENDAERAVLAALEAGARVRGYALHDESQLKLRFGLHVGKVYFGAFGGQYRHDLTAVGSAVDRAYRLTEASAPYEVAISRELKGHVEDAFETSPADGGRGESFLVHSTAEGRSHYLRARSYTRFYAGRESALDVFSNAIDRAMEDDRGTAIGLCGAAGCGKSALLSALIDGWSRRGGIGMLGRCRLATRDQPLAPIAAMFSGFLGLTPNDSLEERRDRIARGLFGLDLGEQLEDVVALLQPVFRPDGTNETAIDLANPDARERLLDAITTVIERRMDAEPTLFVIEDLHEADSLTLELVSRARRILKKRKGLFVGTYRPEPIMRAVRRAMHAEIELLPLTRESTGTLIAHELQADDVDKAFLNFVFERTAGNPRHILELLRFLRERSLLSVRAGVAIAPTTDPTLLSELVPRSLAQMTMARLDELGTLERRLLKTASAIGTRFPQAVLEQAAEHDVDPSALHAAIANLEGEQVLMNDEEARSGWMFRDEVTRAVSYNTLPDRERQRVHGRIADALEKLPSQHPARTPTSLALHRERAGQINEAAAWYERAARLSLRAGMGAETIAHVDRWHAMQELLLPSERSTPTVAAELDLIKLMALGRRGVPAETLAQCRRVVNAHWSLLPEPKRRVVDFWLGDALVQAGELERARERLNRVYAYANESALRCDAAILIARTWEFEHDTALAAEWLDKADALIFGDPYRRLRITLNRAHLFVQPAELERAASIYKAVRDEAAALRHLRIEADATNALAHSQMHRGLFGEAIGGFDDAVGKYRALASWGDVANALVNLGQAYVWAGRHEEACGYLESALVTAREAADELVVTEATVHLGAALALSEDPVRGQRLLAEGKEKARKMAWEEVSLCAALHEAHLAIALGRGDEAAVLLDELKPALARYRTALFSTVFTHLRERLANGGVATLRDASVVDADATEA